MIKRGDKIPSGVYFVPTLAQIYPNYRFVHVIRDIRGVFVSQKEKWRIHGNRKHRGILIRYVHKSAILNEIYSLACVAVSWLRIMQLDEQYRAAYSDCYLAIHYENFVCAPDITTREICDFVGIKYESTMIDASFDNSSFEGVRTPSPPHENSGIEPMRATRWQDQLHPLSRWILKVVAARQLRRLGYEVGKGG